MFIDLKDLIKKGTTMKEQGKNKTLQVKGRIKC
jgi:hypothetical protein